MSQARGEIFDIGYRGYDGPREGRARAYKALWINGVRTTLGIGRGWGSKVMPAILLIAVVTPALVTVILAAASLVDVGAEAANYYSYISLILLLFAAIVAPELLCPDRRDQVLGLYMVRPLTPTDYVAARWLALLSVTLPLVLAGPMVLLAGLTLAAPDPVQFMQDNWLAAPRSLLAGLVVAVFTTTIPLAVSAFTPRRAYAAALVIGVFLISLAVVGTLTSAQIDDSDCVRAASLDGDGVRVTSEPCEYETEYLIGDSAKWFALLSLSEAPTFVNDRIFPGAATGGTAQAVDEHPAAIPIAWYAALTSVFGLALWWRYRRISL